MGGGGAVCVGGVWADAGRQAQVEWCLARGVVLQVGNRSVALRARCGVRMVFGVRNVAGRARQVESVV